LIFKIIVDALLKNHTAKIKNKRIKGHFTLSAIDFSRDNPSFFSQILRFNPNYFKPQNDKLRKFKEK